MSNINNTLEYIIERASCPLDFVSECEEAYNKKIDRILKMVR